MNTIQKSLTTVLALFFCISLAQAQGPGGGHFDKNLTLEERVEKQTAAMTKRLELSEEQATSVKELNLTFAQKAKELRDNAENREAAREQMTAMRKEHAEALKQILTEEQFQKWETDRQERDGERPGKGKGKRGKGKDRKSKN